MKCTRVLDGHDGIVNSDDSKVVLSVTSNYYCNASSAVVLEAKSVLNESIMMFIAFHL